MRDVAFQRHREQIDWFSIAQVQSPAVVLVLPDCLLCDQHGAEDCKELRDWLRVYGEAPRDLFGDQLSAWFPEVSTSLPVNCHGLLLDAVPILRL